ncbi:hypothetical protein IIW_01484 [Bacillus cereus VD136]|nr:hypothetical protein IIW_01484 [Bacillus cereus VD136]
MMKLEYFERNNFKQLIYLDLLKDYSKLRNRTIYACKDGDGIVIDGEDIKLIGKIIKI